MRTMSFRVEIKDQRTGDMVPIIDRCCVYDIALGEWLAACNPAITSVALLWEGVGSECDLIGQWSATASVGPAIR